MMSIPLKFRCTFCEIFWTSLSISARLPGYGTIRRLYCQRDLLPKMQNGPAGPREIAAGPPVRRIAPIPLLDLRQFTGRTHYDRRAEARGIGRAVRGPSEAAAAALIFSLFPN